jgi:FG-GAP-like repeat
VTRLALAAVLTLALAPLAHADTIDIPSAAHLTIVGENPELGTDAAGLGDVNGDGIPDVAVADLDHAVYVVFGRRTPTTVNLASLGSRGFKITGAVDSVAGAGDVNHDGLADVLVASPFEDFSGRTDSGAAYVIFGKATTGTVDLAALGTAGFRIGGPVPLVQNQLLSPVMSVDGIGDVNGDSRADVIVGFAQTQCISFIQTCGDLSGSAYVVYGKASSAAVDTAALGSAGFSITGGNAGAAVAGLGDFNGDGIRDVAVSSRYDNAGWVVFGRRPAANVDLANLGTGGFQMTDSTTADIGGGSQVAVGSVAYSLAGAGDVNADHRPDLLVGSGPSFLGSPVVQLTNVPQRAAVIFGGTSTAAVDIASLGSRGFKMIGGTTLGAAAAGGDTQGDGRADLLLSGGKRRSDTEPPDLGVVDVFGRSSTSDVDVTDLGSQGAYLNGAFASPDSQRSFDGAGDMTGDGIADVVIGARSDGAAAGRAYVVSLKPTALRRLDELRFYIASFGLPTRLRDRFFRKLDRIRFVYAYGDQPAACRRLDRVIALAHRLNGNRLTGAQAFTIVAGAGRVKNAAGCSA